MPPPSKKTPTAKPAPDSIAAFRAAYKTNDVRPKILCEGDSWFAFPWFTGRSNTITHIKDWTDFRWLRLDRSGDEVLQMLAGEQRAKFREVLEEFDFDAILFSGGGNDIVGPDLLPLLRDRKPSYGALDCIDHERFARRLEQVRLAYLDLIALRDDHDPKATLITHGYDHPVPSDRPVKVAGVKVAGPWMHPYMLRRGITDPKDQRAIAGWMMDQLNGMLLRLEADTPRFYVAKTVKTLSAADWGDEIHPTTDGFGMIARKFHPIFRELFPQHTTA